MLDIQSREKTDNSWSAWIPEGDMFVAIALWQLVRALEDSCTEPVCAITVRWADNDKTQFILDA